MEHWDSVEMGCTIGRQYNIQGLLLGGGMARGKGGDVLQLLICLAGRMHSHSHVLICVRTNRFI